MIRRPPRSTLDRSSAASDVYKRQGLGTIGIGTGGQDVYAINGTSFSSPLVAGLTACLWQLHPDRTAHDVMTAVRRSASQHDHPDDDLGYGIPDFWRAHLLLGGRDLTHLADPTVLAVMPVPFTDFLDIEVYAGESDAMDLKIYDMLGRKLWASTTGLEPGTYSRVPVSYTHLRAHETVLDLVCRLLLEKKTTTVKGPKGNVLWDK